MWNMLFIFYFVMVWVDACLSEDCFLIIVFLCTFRHLSSLTRWLEDCISTVQRPFTNCWIFVPDGHQCIWMAIIRSESCAHIWTGSSQSPLRTAYHGASCYIWGSVGSECPQFLVQLFFKYSTICQSIGSHCYHDRIHPQSNQDIPTWS